MLTGRALSRRAAIAAAVPPLIRLHSDEASIAKLAAELGQPMRLVTDAARALEHDGWVLMVGGRVRLTLKATATLDEWETEMAGALG